MNKIVYLLISITIFSCRQSEADLLKAASQYAEKEDYSKSVELNTKVIQINNKNELAYYNRGLSYLSLDSNQRALNDFNKVLALKGGKPEVELVLTPSYTQGEQVFAVSYLDALYQRGKTHYLMDSLSSALIDLKTCVESEYEQKGICCLLIGDIYRAYKKPEQACEYYRKAVLLGVPKAAAVADQYCN